MNQQKASIASNGRTIPIIVSRKHDPQGQQQLQQQQQQQQQQPVPRGPGALSYLADDLDDLVRLVGRLAAPTRGMLTTFA